MSVEHTTYVWKHADLTRSNELLVLLAMADKVGNEEGLSWLAVPTIAEMTRLSERTVQRMLRELVAAGELEVVREGGGKRATLYRILMPSLPRHPVTPDASGVTSGGDTAVTHKPSTDQSSPRKENKIVEHGEFGEWMGDHSDVTGQQVLKAGTQARKHVAAMFAARREEGYSLDELKLATRGAFADDFRRENGHIGPESILRPTKVAGLIEKGRQARAPKMLRDPLTGMEFAAGTYS